MALRKNVILRSPRSGRLEGRTQPIQQQTAISSDAWADWQIPRCRHIVGRNGHFRYLGDTTMADGTTPITPAAPAEAVTPGGINHLVINVRDMAESHKFWSEILGFKLVGKSSRRPMQFYSGDHGGPTHHHAT